MSKWKVGKIYLTRGGREVYVEANDRKGSLWVNESIGRVPQPIMGHYVGYTSSMTWGEDGSFVHSSELHPADLMWVEHKEEPKRFECDFIELKSYVNMEGDEKITIVNMAPFNAEEAWKATKLAAGDVS